MKISTNPLNLMLRFILELAALVTFAIWGYSLEAGPVRIVPAILLPLVFASLWGIFAVRGDPSRSGRTVVSTPGWIRLILEITLFAAATWMLFDLGYRIPGTILGTLLLLHYTLSLDRIKWLFKQR